MFSPPRALSQTALKSLEIAGVHPLEMIKKQCLCIMGACLQSCICADRERCQISSGGKVRHKIESSRLSKWGGGGIHTFDAVQSQSYVQLFETPMDCSTPGFPVLPYLLDFAQIHDHWVSDAI